MPSNDRTRTLDEESQAMLYQGLNISQLEKAFRMDSRTLQEKLVGVKPSGERNGYKIWRIDEVAPYLARLTAEDIERYLPRMHYKDLPKDLTKEYWAGKRSKQAWEKENGDLWPTIKVVAYVSEFVKMAQMSFKLLSDSVERTTELTDKQRSIIKGYCNGASSQLAKMMRERFTNMPGDVVKESTDEERDDEEL